LSSRRSGADVARSRELLEEARPVIASTGFAYLRRRMREAEARM
jgi:hypothetical protein